MCCSALHPEAAAAAAAAAKNSDDSDDEIQIVSVKQGPPNYVFIVLTCDYPLQNDKRGEHSGHETQDTEILAVFANQKQANEYAKTKWYEYCDPDDDEDYDDDDSEEDYVDGLFYKQEEEPDEWEAKRIWVEKKNLIYPK